MVRRKSKHILIKGTLMKINFTTYRYNYYLSRPFAGRSQLSEEEIAKEYESIENAITLIKENPQYPLSLHTICDITKLSAL